MLRRIGPWNIAIKLLVIFVPFNRVQRLAAAYCRILGAVRVVPAALLLLLPLLRPLYGPAATAEAHVLVTATAAAAAGLIVIVGVGAVAVVVAAYRYVTIPTAATAAAAVALLLLLLLRALLLLIRLLLLLLLYGRLVRLLLQRCRRNVPCTVLQLVLALEHRTAAPLLVQRHSDLRQSYTNDFWGGRTLMAQPKKQWV